MHVLQQVFRDGRILDSKYLSYEVSVACRIDETGKRNMVR